MSKLVLEIIKFIIDLIEKACAGNEDALQRLCEFIPEEMRTELIAKTQDAMDEKKFGPRIERTTDRP